MPFEQLEKVILAAAQEQAEHVQQNNQREIRQAEEHITKKAQAVEEKIIADAHQAAERESRLIHQTARLQAKADILQAKQAELAAVQAEAMQQIMSRPEKELTALLQHLLALLPKEAGTITAAEAHLAFIKKELRSDHTLADETIPDDGGFIFENAQVRIDCRFSQLLAELVRRHRTLLAQELFGA